MEKNWTERKLSKIMESITKITEFKQIYLSICWQVKDWWSWWKLMDIGNTTNRSLKI